MYLYLLCSPPHSVLWQKIYISDFGSRTWRPKSVASDAALQVDQDQHQDQDQDQDQDQEDRAAGYWKKMYFRTVAGQDVNNWKRERRDVSPLTGLPLRTRNLNVSWELMLCGEPGQKITMQPSRVDFFESSAVLHFSGAHFPRYHRIRSILLHGVRKEAQRSPRAGRPGWRSLILKLEVKNRPSWFFGKDNLVRLRHFLPGVTIGTWRCEDTVVFIMVTLHFHKLVERSLLGSPVCPYSEPVDLPPADHSDPVFGLHGYTLHFVLHDNANKIMSGTFSQLSCRTVPVQGGLVELRVIDRYNLSQHRSLSGGIKLPWSTDTLEGSVENCCIMTLTLLDDFQKPFWSVSSSVFVVPATRPLSPDYVGEHFLLHFRDPEGQLRMELVRLTEQRQFLVIGLVVNLPVLKVNKRFGRAY
uniref:F-box protein 15 n=1 Tax=Cyclopterus lumpus TaxID=8103 RepID=A0A8C3AGR5_CYCLU